MKQLSPGFKLVVFITLLIVVLVSVGGCGNMDPYLRVGVGHVVNEVPGSGGPAFMSHVGAESERYYCQWTHHSMVNRGRPFDNRPEPTLDWVGCGVQFGGPERERHSWLFEGGK